MAKLTAATRNAIPKGEFALPGKRKYPIEDANHARNALSRAAHQGGSVQKTVDAAVHSKYPGIGNANSGMSGIKRS